MKRVTTCAFCNLGCYLKGDGKNGWLEKVEYYKDSIYKGRLCPRGNAGGLLYNYPKRISEPRINGRKSSWNKAIQLLKEKAKEFKKDEVAIIFDESLTQEEVDGLKSIAGFFNTERVYWGFAEPEVCFSYVEKTPANLEDIENIEVAIIIGDLFSKIPCGAGFIIDRKEKGNLFIIVIDCLFNTAYKFANLPVILPVQKIPLFLYTLLVRLGMIKKPVLPKESLEEGLRLKEGVIDKILEILNTKKKVGLFYTPCAGRSIDPVLEAYLINEICKISENILYYPFGVRIPERWAYHTGQLVSDIISGSVRAVISFGYRFPWLYPHLKPFFKKVKFSLYSSFIIPDALFMPEVLLPMYTPFEKSGSISVLTGKRELTSLGIFSGPKDVVELKNMLSGKEISFPSSSVPKVSISERMEKILVKKKKKKGFDFMILGEERAFGFFELYEKENYIKLNPEDASKLGIRNKDNVYVETEEGRTMLVAWVSQDVGVNTAVVSMNHIESRAIMNFAIDKDTNDAFLLPSWGRIWKA